jgi:hypothetical protein
VAQGFRIDEVHEGAAGDFADIEIRIEAPAQIDHLTIREGSYEVDLARSPEQSHYALFGLAKRVYAHKDVTLNFRNYVNDKLAQAGRYQFEITATDKRARSAAATLVVVVNPVELEPGEEPEPEGRPEVAPDAEGAQAVPTQRGDFRFERIGAASVAGADTFDITWRTVRVPDVVIRLTGASDADTRLARLPGIDYDAIATRAQLARAVEAGESALSLEIATARGLAAGEMFAVLTRERPYVLRARSSATSLSELGTTVTLAGEYKY